MVQDILFSGRTEEIRITLISSIDQLGYFLDEYVLQPIGIKQRLMQLQRFFRELLTSALNLRQFDGKETTTASASAAGDDRSTAVLASHTHRRAILWSPKNHWFSKCDVVEEFGSKTRAHEKFMLFLEAHH